MAARKAENKDANCRFSYYGNSNSGCKKQGITPQKAFRSTRKVQKKRHTQHARKYQETVLRHAADTFLTRFRYVLKITNLIFTYSIVSVSVAFRLFRCHFVKFHQLHSPLCSFFNLQKHIRKKNKNQLDVFFRTSLYAISGLAFLS